MRQKGLVRERCGSWIGRWRQKLPSGKSTHRSFTLGRIDAMTKEEAQQRLNELISHDHRQTYAAHAILGGSNTKVSERISRLNRGVKAQAVGAAAEAVVTADLLMRGFEIFKAVHNGAGTDLLAVDGLKFYRVEVKAAKIRKDGRADCDLRHNWGKFDVLAIVPPEPGEPIVYRSHGELDGWSRPTVVGLKSDFACSPACSQTSTED